VVVTPASLIQEAREELRCATLVRAAEKGKELIIAGCLVQHSQEELLESLPRPKRSWAPVLPSHRGGAGAGGGWRAVNPVSASPLFRADETLPR